jgi:hypothetical protein
VWRLDRRALTDVGLSCYRRHVMRIWTTMLCAVFLVGCGGVNTSDDKRIGPRNAATGEEDEDEEPAEDPADAGVAPAPVDAGASDASSDATLPVPAGSFAAGTELETTASLNLRAGEGTEFEILATMPEGTRVKVQTTSGASGWVHLNYDGTIGYASKMYLKVP